MKGAENEKQANAFIKTDGGRTKSNAIEIPSLSLPKGGGAIKGIDEKFSVNAVNGTAAFSIPLPFSKARGASPSLNLSYNSGSGNGVFGLGWSLGLASIKRKTENELPQYQDGFDSDTFLLSEAEDLVPEFEKNLDGSLVVDPDDNYVIREQDSPDGAFTIRFYKPRIEGQFARIERWSSKTSPEIKWRVITKENVTTLFGWTTASRISDPATPSRIFAWFPEFVFDDKGNCSRYLYKEENDDGFDPARLHNRNRFASGDITYTNTYLSKVLYGNNTPYQTFGDPFPAVADFMFETVFDYGEFNLVAPFDEVADWSFRQDAFSLYKSGFEIRTTRLCRRVLLFHHFVELPGGSALVKSLDFEYDAGPTFTFLTSITSRGFIKRTDGSYTSKSMPPTEFGYQKPDWNKEVKTISAENLVHSPAGLADASYQFTDLFNEGLSGILSEKGNGWYYKHNLGGGVFAPAKLVSPKPSFTGFGQSGGLQLLDLDGDGGKQIVNYGNEPRGFFELNDENEWLPFRAFLTSPNVDLRDSNARQLDLSGDGRPDVLITEDAVFTWYQSAGRNGFELARKIPKQIDEEIGPHVVFAEATQTIFLADMTGDGLTDIVRVRNGEVCYWPNLGYGKFGAKIAMDDAPVFDHPETFNPALIRLADLDGSGVADIIYLGENQFSCWMNRSGNGYDPFPFEIDPFPAISNPAHVDVVDLLGNGVPCIVHSSELEKDVAAPLRYVDLMNGKKPHLMIGYKNNLGKEVSLEYAPSTRFYVEDKLAGRPWVTKLHFPVHCIVRSETRDKVSGARFVSSYKYHHGYYDHAEKEFRGFGMIEQTDAEHFENWVKGAATNIVERELHQAPVLTKSWFHTGAFLRLERILDQYADEHWYEEMRRHGHTVVNNEVPLPDARLITAPGLDPGLIDDLSGEEWCEALRACKGTAVRVETFAKDAPLIAPTPDQLKLELIPFTAATHNCVIELIQPKGKNKHAVYVVKESEAITYSYERETDDPRITHKLNLKFDQYANVLESASIVYPRLDPDTALPAETQQAQSRTLISYVRTTFTDDVDTADDYRLRMAAEVESYQLKGVAKSGTLYAVEDFDDILTTSTSVEYHQLDVAPPPGTSQKRLIEHIRTLFYRNDLTGPLSLHQLSRHGLRFEQYQLAYTPLLLTDIFGPRVDAALMLEGKFTNSGDTNWWVRSGTIQYITGPESLAAAEARFFVPISYTDPFGATTKVQYFSNYFLLVEETEDALQNKTTALSFNLRTLSPQRLRDPNDNISEAVSDELGLIKAVASFGKGAEADDLTGINEFTSPAESALISNFLGAPDSVQLTVSAKALLQHATSYFVYDLNAYLNSGGAKPSVAASIVREQHFVTNANSPVQVSFEYSDGLGKVLMKKVQAEPGVAKRVTVNPDNTYSVSEVDTSASIPELLRWVANGRTILNNKGNPVKQYEPYFSVTHQFENLKELVETGVTPILYYDALGRKIKTEFPDSTFSKMVFTSWEEITYDQNDTVQDSDWYNNRFNNLIDAELTAAGKDPAREKVAAERAAKHHDTPAIRHVDTLGRAVGLREHNKNSADADLFYHSRMDIDLEGNLRKITDARNNVVMQYKYDMLGNKVYENGRDAGQRWLLQNVVGSPLRTWDERNHELSFVYDVLHRPISKKVEGGDGATPLDNVYERTIYGENLPNDKANNLRTKAVTVYDCAGKSETSVFDFKGNPRQGSRRFAQNYKDVVDWAGATPDSKLDLETFPSEFTYDALNRVVLKTTPDGSICETTFNEAGLLETVKVTQNGNEEFFVTNIDYNEKGQRTRILFGNNVSTDYFYDRETFRLIRLVTKRSNNDPLQDLHYTFDPIGNITHTEDRNVPVVFFDNQKIAGVASYIYDPLYRLIEATGRENVAAVTFGQFDNWNDQPFLRQYSQGDPMAWRNYTQQYDYDEVGNLDEMRHVAAGGNWTRAFAYPANSNRLQSTTANGDTYNYTHHPQHGFLTALPHLTVMKWNFKDELQAVAQQSVLAGTPETTWYVYDGGGQRVRKITENQAAVGVDPTRKAERFYVSGVEVYREYGAGGGVDLERKTCHVMDDKTRIAMIESRTEGVDDTPPRLVRYQFSNHLGSACIETDAAARVITYEEFHPFGTTSHQANDRDLRAAAKRYRYTAMERDEESGLEYHSARYYLPWLGRWLSPDPKGLVDGPNLYRYGRNNPIKLNDPNGTDPPATDEHQPPVRVTPLLTQSPVPPSGTEPAQPSDSVRSTFILQVPRREWTTTGFLDVTQLGTAPGTDPRNLRVGLILGDPTSGLNLVTVGTGTFLLPGAEGVPLVQLPGVLPGILPQAEGDFRFHGAFRSGTFSIAEFQGEGTLHAGAFDTRLSAFTFGNIGRLTLRAQGNVGEGGAVSFSSVNADATVRVPVLLSLQAHVSGTGNASGGVDLSGSAQMSMFGIPSLSIQGTGTASSQGVDFSGTFRGLGPLATSYVLGDFSLSTSRGISARAAVFGVTYTPEVSITDPEASRAGIGPVAPAEPWNPTGLTVGAGVYRYSQGGFSWVSGGWMPEINDKIISNPRFGVTAGVAF